MKSIEECRNTLDAYFERDDMKGAGEYLRSCYHSAQVEHQDRLLFFVLNEMMGFYRKTGEVEYGLIAIEESLSLTAKLGIENTVSGATTYLNAATTLKAYGMASESLSYYQIAEDIYLRELTPNDPKIAGLCNNLALALVDLDRLQEAEERYLKALSILNRNYGKETDIANTYVNLAHLYEKREDYEKIEICLEKAFQTLEEDPNRNGYYAYTCRKCAPSFGYFGYFVYEIILNERANRIYERN